MSGEPKTLTLTLEEALARLGRSDLRLLYVEGISLWRVFDGDGVIADGQNWPEAVSGALGVPVVARDEAAELRAENERMRKALDTVDSFLSHEYHRNGHRLTDKEWAADVLRQVEAITRRRLAGGEEQE